MKNLTKYQFDDNAISEIAQLLSLPKDICIVTHVNPDGDAIGSSLALYNLLLKAGHTVSVVTPNQMMTFLKWMQNADKVFSFVDQTESAKAAIRNANIIFCIDFNNLLRIEGASDFILENQKATRILIDHHLEPQNFCQFTFSFPEACATAELIFYFIYQLGLSGFIDASIAECLYCGIMTDSGNFRFSSVSPELHEITASLLRNGVNHNKIHELIYDSNSFKTIQLQGYVMAEKMLLAEGGNAVIISLSKAEQEKFNAGKTEIDDVVNLGLKIEGVKISAFFYENEEKVRVSFRSKGQTSVKDIAMKYYNGGGHLNAAGGISPINITDTVLKFKELLKEIQIK